MNALVVFPRKYPAKMWKSLIWSAYQSLLRG